MEAIRNTTMAIHRALWEEPITYHKTPPWPCPTCKVGILQLKEDSLHHDQSWASRDARDEPDWDPEWVVGRFSCLLYCNNAKCGEVVSVAGKQGTEWQPTEQDPFCYQTYFMPEYMSPAPDIFPIPEQTPEVVASEIRKAFELFWVDTSASANRIRSSLEILLTIKRVKRHEQTNKGRKSLSLHRRIELFSLKEPELGQSLMAVKWLGNAGSHSSPISRDDIFDGLDILHHTLEVMFNDRTKIIRKLRAEINRRKGPRKPRI